MARIEDMHVKIPALVHTTRLGYTYMSIHKMKPGVDYDGDTNTMPPERNTVCQSD